MKTKNPKVYEIETINKGFDSAFKELAKYHTAEYIVGNIFLIFDKRPKGIRTNKDWKYYFGNLIRFIGIGKRNKWLRTHVDGQGFPIFLTIDGKFYKKGEK